MGLAVPYRVRHNHQLADEILGDEIGQGAVEFGEPVATDQRPQMPGFEELGISPRPVEELLQEMLRDH